MGGGVTVIIPNFYFLDMVTLDNTHKILGIREI